MSQEPGTRGGVGLDLSRPRTIAELLATTLGLFRSHFRLVLACASPIIVLITVIEGIGLDQITGPYQTQLKEGVLVIEPAITFLVVMPLVNAVLALLLREIGAGHPVTARELIPRALEVFAPALLAALMNAAAIVLGLSLLVVPGIYILVLWFFATQSVAIDGKSAVGALARSSELVRGNWLRVFGTISVLWVLFGLVPGELLGTALDALARAADTRSIEFAGQLVFQLLWLPFVALGSGLLFFGLRAARAAAPLPGRR